MLNTEESRAGAMACLQGMQAVMQLQYHQESEGTMQDGFDYLDAANSEILKAAGNQAEFVKGFMSALSEFNSVTMTGGIYDVFAWKPEAAMTDEEKAAHRASHKEVTA